MKKLITQDIEEKLAHEQQHLKDKLANLQHKLANITDYSSQEYVSLQKTLINTQERLNKIKTLLKLLDQLKQAQAITTDPSSSKELIELAQHEIAQINPNIEQLYKELTSPDQEVNAFILEIRAGAGGEEAALFARDLFRMYQLFIQDIGGNIVVNDVSYADQGGYKFVSAYVKGPNIYRWFKYESGVHRVQRVPTTESGGRIHTSTASVAILPEYPEDINIQINPDDVEITPIKASGPGGQHVNKNLTAIRIKHIPTGIIVTSQRYKSQKQNREFALKLLKLKLTQQKKQEITGTISKLRKQQIGTMDRSEKIRTYNFPQSRVTDHRIKKSWYNLTDIMDGKIKKMLEEIIIKLEEKNEE